MEPICGENYSHPTSALRECTLSSDSNEAQLAEYWEEITSCKQQLISGFLSLGKKDSVKEEGGSYELGVHFVSYYIKKFCRTEASCLSTYGDIFARAIKIFGTYVGEAEKPTMVLDTSISGWEGHAISRLVGYLTKEQNENGPFFELLINSQRAVGTDTYTLPFRVTIYLSRESLKRRSDALKIIQIASKNFAHPIYYADSAIKIEQFAVREIVPPYTKRLLDGLKFLDEQIEKAQVVGNCWIKQPKRSVYASLFIEIIAKRSELSCDQAYKLAKMLYRNWKQFIDSELKVLMCGGGINKEIIPTIQKKLLCREFKAQNY